MHQPRVVVVSAASGTGKGSLIAAACHASAHVRVSVSCTTRKPRRGEKHGVQYYFTPIWKFLLMILFGRFAEWAYVHGNFYGTSKAELRRDGSKIVLLEIDCQGARKIKKKIPSVVLLFIFPPTFNELENRLRKRGTEDEAALARRLRNARGEFTQAENFDYFIINHDLGAAVADLRNFLACIADGGTPDRMKFGNPTLFRSTLSILGCS